MDTRRLATVFVLCLLAVTMFLGTIRIGHATTITVDRTFSSLAYDGYITYSDTVYDWVWRNDMGTVYDTGFSFAGGQYYYSSTYYIYRSFLFFDTSTIASSATILNATLSLNIFVNGSVTDFNVTVQHGRFTFTEPDMPLTANDYSESNYAGNGGSRNTSEISALGYWNISLNSYGVSWITKAGTTKLVLRSSNDIDQIAPTTNEYLQIYANEHGEAYSPKLDVWYETTGNQYIIHGPYYENGAVADCTTTVTLQIEYMASESTVLNGTDGIADTYTFQKEQAGLTLSWNITESSNYTRYIWLITASCQEYWIFIPDPDKPCYLYTFTINDFVGISNATLESQIVFNGFMKTVEREPFIAGNSIPFYLSWGRHYTFVLTCDKGTKTWNNIVPSSASDIQFVITLDDFPQILQTLNVELSVYRQNNTCVSLSYMDNDADTMNGTVIIWHTVDDVVTEDNVTLWNGTTLILDWNEADETLDYWVNVSAYKGGETYSWVRTAPHIESVEPWSGVFDAFGVWPVPSQYLAGAFVLFTVMSLFTAANISAGLIISTILAAILNYIRWLNVSWSLVAVAFALSVLVALEEAKRKQRVGL